MSTAFFEELKKTNIENWPSALLRESISTMIYRLNKDEVNAIKDKYFLIEAEDEGKCTMNQDTVNYILRELAIKLYKYIANYPKGAFVKLGSRSPKDSFNVYKDNFKCTDGNQALSFILDSERTIDDLFMFDKHGYRPCIAIREWLEIPRWSEFRAFIKDKKFVGLTQYDYLDGHAHPEIIQNADAIQWAIEKKIERIKDILPLHDVIADFFVKIKSYGNENLFEVKLIELNPFSAWTDPCLFDWNTDTFEKFEFRYIKN